MVDPADRPAAGPVTGEESRAPARVAQNEPKPLYRVLGTCDVPGAERRYCLELADGRVIAWRSSELIRLGAVMEIVPDAAHWRACFPGRAGRIDVQKAAGAIMAACRAAGPIEPDALPEGVRPRPVGRPKKEVEE